MTTEMSLKLNLFISYAHEDGPMVDRLITHIKPLDNKNSIQIWWDRKNQPGSSFMALIDKQLAQSDIVLLCLSSNYLVSESWAAQGFCL